MISRVVLSALPLRSLGTLFGRLIVSVVFQLLIVTSIAAEAPYDPLDPLHPDSAVEVVDLEAVRMVNNVARYIPLRVYCPRKTAVAGGMPVIVFSHGLGGSRENNPYLGRHWARRGYVAVFMQHLGSDEGVWKNTSALMRLSAMRKAASAGNLFLRLEDVPAVIDFLEGINKTPGQSLHGRLDLERLGLAGHSFGAMTAQGIAGQRYPLIGSKYREPRVRAIVAMSPSAPRRGISDERAFGEIKIPALLMTGTHDQALTGNDTPESRQRVFPALPPGGKYELVLDGAEHMAFSERALRTDQRKRNPNHHRAILALSTAFCDAYLRDDATAKEWLDGKGPSQVLEQKDRFLRK